MVPPRTVGYACINTQLQALGIKCSRGMVKRTFAQRGPRYASELALQNCQDLLETVKWNNKQDVKIFRMTSDLFPWASEYDIMSLQNIRDISSLLQEVGREAARGSQRLTFHPGQFNVLGSLREDVVNNTIKELETHSLILDLIGAPQSAYSKINIHVGAAYGDKCTTSARFVKNFRRLNAGTRSRLTLENDDKCSLYSVRDLYEMIYTETGIPIVFDAHHHDVGPKSGLNHEQAFKMASSTWGDITPVVHMSSSACLEGKRAPIQAHSDYILSRIDLFSPVDLMIEAKMKEEAMLKYKKDFL